MKKAVLGVVAMALIAVTPAFAAPAASSASSSSMSGSELLFGTGGEANFTLSPLTVTIPVVVGYQRMFMPNIQLGLRGNFTIGQTASNWLAQVWGTYNLDENLADSIFIGVGAGVAGGATTAFAWGAEVGKRFELATGVSYRPTLELRHQTGGNATLHLNFLNFSAMW